MGHSVRSLPVEGPRTYLYAGLQFNLPRQFSFEPARRRVREGVN
jgi:hypothetical protein